MSIPVAGTFFSIVKTRDFSSEIGGLLQSGLSMQNALDVLIDQNLDAVLSEIAKNVKEQVVFGDSFHTAIGRTEGLTEQLSAFAKHGEDSGYLPKELHIYSEHLSETIDEKLSEGIGDASASFVQYHCNLYFGCLSRIAFTCLRNDG